MLPTGMTPSGLDAILSPLDAAALAFFLFAVASYRLLGALGPLHNRSLSGVVQAQRVRWMLNMAQRGDHRTMDVILLNNLAQGNAFFASTSAIAIGGMTALLGSSDKAQKMMAQIPYAMPSGAALWEGKLMLIMGIFIFAFFKFAWAFRLGHYTAIMIGATPLREATNGAACDRHAERTARLAGLSAEHSNGGLRSFYYAIAAMAWFFHPLAFIAATLWVMAILTRREFFSRSRRLIAEAGAA